VAATTTMRPERFIHSSYRLGPNRHDALGYDIRQYGQ
jgi:hypothetical protein